MTGVSGAVHWDVGDTGTQKIIFHIVPLRGSGKMKRIITTNLIQHTIYKLFHFFSQSKQKLKIKKFACPVRFC